MGQKREPWLTWSGRRRNWGGILVDFPQLGVVWGMGEGWEGGAGVYQSSPFWICEHHRTITAQIFSFMDLQSNKERISQGGKEPAIPGSRSAFVPFISEQNPCTRGGKAHGQGCRDPGSLLLLEFLHSVLPSEPRPSSPCWQT